MKVMTGSQFSVTEYYGDDASMLIAQKDMNLLAERARYQDYADAFEDVSGSGETHFLPVDENGYILTFTEFLLYHGYVTDAEIPHFCVEDD